MSPVVLRGIASLAGNTAGRTNELHLYFFLFFFYRIVNLNFLESLGIDTKKNIKIGLAG